MSSRTLRRGPAWIAAVVFLGGCALPTTQEPGAQQPPAATTVNPGEWRFGSREHVSLWYYGLSYVLAPLDSLPLPIYDLAGRETALSFARRAGVTRTAMQAAADSIRREFTGSSTYQQLQFLPLYFDNADAFFTAIRLWEQAQGDPQRAGSQQGAEAVQLLSNIFQTERQRRWIARFAGVLEEERRTWYDAYWREREPELRRLADAAQHEWNALATSLQSLLRYLQVDGGEALLTPSIVAEGRTVNTRGLMRSAVGIAPPAAGGQDIAFELLHELMYSLVGDVVKENVAPARLLDAGEEAVTAVAAVRAGELVLMRLAPDRAEAYRRLYLRAAGRSGTGQAAFRAAFPLLPELEQPLPRAVEQALAGI